MSDQQANTVNVINPAEGKRYKMTLRGDISRLSMRKLKKYLVASSGIPAEEQCLKYNGVDLSDEVLGGEVGIVSGCTLTVERRSAPSEPFVASPARQALEMETLEQQRNILYTEHARRDDEFRRQQEAIHASVNAAERRRAELEREKAEKEAELQRIHEMETLAQKEKERLDAVRRAEQEREALRARDLEARKEQLAHEKTQQRQLEMMRLENERKKMLLQQQRAEYEGEKARLERERKERRERIKKQEMLIREREVDLERAAIEAEQQRQELEVEKAMLEQQRRAEFGQMGVEPPTDAATPRIALTPARAAASTPRLAHQMPQQQQQQRSGSWGSGDASHHSNPQMAELERLRAEREALERQDAENDQLARELEAERQRIEELRASRGAGASRSNATTPRAAPAQPLGSQTSGAYAPSDIADGPNEHRNIDDAALRLLAKDNLKLLAEDLGVPSLELDDNNTCVVSVEDRYTLLLTFDAPTQRLYLYSTLSTFIPTSADVKLRLYEFLLEGALLGRDMCGGGVGVSLKNDFVLLSTSIFLPKSATTALRTITPVFVDNLVKWRSRVREVLQVDDATSATGLTSDHHHHGHNNNNTASVVHPAVMTHTPQRFEAPSSTAGSTSSAAEQPVVGVEVTESEAGDGVVVVSARGPAARAGILANDAIRAVNDVSVSNLRDFQRAIRSLRPNVAAPFVVERAGTQLQANVLVGSSRTRGATGDSRYGNVVRVPSAGVPEAASGRVANR